MYLTSGPHGPYFLLHNFRATGALDSEDMKSLKVAGTLRYKVNCHNMYGFMHLCSYFLFSSE